MQQWRFELEQRPVRGLSEPLPKPAIVVTTTEFLPQPGAFTDAGRNYVQDRSDSGKFETITGVDDDGNPAVLQVKFTTLFSTYP